MLIDRMLSVGGNNLFFRERSENTASPLARALSVGELSDFQPALTYEQGEI